MQADVLGESRAQALTAVLEDPAPQDPDAITRALERLPATAEPARMSLEPELRAFVEHLVRVVDAHVEEIDAVLARAARNWEVGRMAAVDRNVLRLGAAELLYCPDVPVRVALNEAILLAKRYGGGDSGGFVNGILDRVALDARQQDG